MTGHLKSDSEAESAGETRNIASGDDPSSTSPAPMDVRAKDISKESEDKELAEDKEGEMEDVDDDDDNNIICPKKPSHLVFGKSIIKEDYFKYYKEMNFIKDVERCRRPTDDETPMPAPNGIVLFECFFTGGFVFQ